MEKWNDPEAAYKQGFIDGMESAPDDASGVMAVIVGAFGGFATGLIVAAIVYLITT